MELNSGEFKLIDLLKDIQEIGIPHFQRGLVWNEALEKELIDSLKQGFKIGTFLFWKPSVRIENFSNYGIPFDSNNKAENLKYFIIDGQQRLNTILKFYKGEIKFIEDGSEIKHYDSKKGGTCIIPEKLLGEIKIIIDVIENDIEYAIKNYVKTNTAGKRVEQEEKVFAKMISLDGFQENFNIKELYENIHPIQSHKADERRNQLARKRESQFGFKTFLRILFQVCIYHLGISIKKGNIDFNYYVDDIFTKLNSLDIEKRKNIFTISQEIILFLASEKDGIIRKELLFDDLRFFPESAMKRIRPVIQMIIVHPEIKQERDLITNLILRFILTPINDNDVYKLTSQISTNTNFNKAYQKIISFEKIETKSIIDKMHERLSVIRTVQDEYTLLLYSLLRKNDAQDFVVTPRLEGVISQTHNPEKQHIIPISRFIAINGNRRNTHIGNNIGNITYISGRQNGLNGLADNYAPLSNEQDYNLKAHFLDNVILDNYLYFAANPLFNIDGENDERYNRMLERRKILIIDAWKNWLEEYPLPLTLNPKKNLIFRTSRIGFPLDNLFMFLRAFKVRVDDDFHHNNIVMKIPFQYRNNRYNKIKLTINKMAEIKFSGRHNNVIKEIKPLFGDILEFDVNKAIILNILTQYRFNTNPSNLLYQIFNNEFLNKFNGYEIFQGFPNSDGIELRLRCNCLGLFLKKSDANNNCLCVFFGFIFEDTTIRLYAFIEANPKTDTYLDLYNKIRNIDKPSTSGFKMENGRVYQIISSIQALDFSPDTIISEVEKKLKTWFNEKADFIQNILRKCGELE